MKNLIIIAIAALSFSAPKLNAQEKDSKKTIQTTSIKVDGVCGECKKRIEDAAYIPGVKRAEWDKATKELKVVYSSKKTSLLKIEESIAHTGHNAGEVKALRANYDKLPACCAYEDGHDH